MAWELSIPVPQVLVDVHRLRRSTGPDVVLTTFQRPEVAERGLERQKLSRVRSQQRRRLSCSTTRS